MLIVGSAMAQDARDWLNRGVTAFKNAQYAEATADFQKAADLTPGDATPRLYLATTYMHQYIPGADSRENIELARRAEDEFERVLSIDAANRVAVASIASLKLNEKQWDEARNWYRRLLNLDPNSADAYYSLGYSAWSEWYPAYSDGRKKSAMKPADPGPFTDAGVRNTLRAEYWSKLDDGLRSLNKALEINPLYDDAMAYINLLIRERADLRDTREEWTLDVAEADRWVQKALDTKKAKGLDGGGGRGDRAHPQR